MQLSDAARIAALTLALRKLAIVPGFVLLGGTNKARMGWRCRCCGFGWQRGATQNHAPECVLVGDAGGQKPG